MNSVATTEELMIWRAERSQALQACEITFDPGVTSDRLRAMIVPAPEGGGVA